MTNRPTTPEHFALPTPDDVLERWEAKATFWDEQMADGNEFHRLLVGPTTERLLAVQQGERILDASCGNGVLSRQLARLGAHVVATDFSATFIERSRARAKAAELSDVLDYRVVDSTDEAALVALGEGEFDGMTCTMAIQDMPEIAPLFRAAKRLLRLGGRFVVVLPHPSFNQTHAIPMVEREDREGTLVDIAAVKLRAYLTPHATLGVGMPGEPTPHYYFHRPLQDTLNVAFAAGLVLDGIEEVAPPSDGSPPSLSWRSRPEFPSIVALRLRRLA